jgi:hypothetical protein
MKAKKLTPVQKVVLANLRNTGRLSTASGGCCTARTFNHLHMDGLLGCENHKMIVSAKGIELLDAIKK